VEPLVVKPPPLLQLGGSGSLGGLSASETPSLLCGTPLAPTLASLFPSHLVTAAAAGHPGSPLEPALCLPLEALLGGSAAEGAIEARKLGWSSLRAARALPPRSAREAYCEAMKEEAFCLAEGVSEGHLLLGERAALSVEGKAQLQRELSSLAREEESHLVSWGSSIIVRVDEDKTDVIKFAITGSDATPCESAGSQLPLVFALLRSTHPPLSSVPCLQTPMGSSALTCWWDPSTPLGRRAASSPPLAAALCALTPTWCVSAQ
jgi:hypothetical protein